MFDKDFHFGFIDTDGFEHAPIHMSELGFETQTESTYFFDNQTRPHPQGFVFQYTFDGCGILCLDGVEHLLPAGTGFLIPIPHNSQYYLASARPKQRNIPPDKAAFWQLGYLVFDGIIGEEICKKLESPIISLPTNSTPIQHLLSESKKLQAGKKYGRYENSEFTYRLLLELLREIEMPLISSTPCVENALQWLHENYTCACNISDMCSEIGVSLSHISRQFFAAKGISPSNYLLNLRLEHALSLLREPSLPIQEVALQSGFSCGNYFSKVFRRSLGITPSEYRISTLRT